MSRPADVDVIAAIATAPGRSGIGVVRISGRNLASLAARIIGRVPEPRRATRASFLDARGRAIDDGIALYFPAPASYTGEDVLELQGHGGPVVLQMLLRRSLELGARLAEPGEFTRRAFLNDKLDLAQAEGVADLIDAATEAAARCALRSLRGEFSAVVDTLLRQLIDLRMLVEATLDFPEEEIDSLDRANARERLARLRAEIDHALAQGRQGSVLRAGLQVVLAGAPNVGKSSLLNRLAGEELAIVTEIPGTTRDTVRQTIQIEGVPINIIDTAGLRETADRIEAIGIARTWAAIARGDALLLVVDAAVGITAQDQAIIERLPGKLARLIVFNKIDLTGGEPRTLRMQGETHLWVSALTGAGLDRLRAALLEIAGWQATGEDVFMARERHLVALARAAECLARAEAEMERPELFAEELRLAQAELNAITGEFTADDLLGEIFSRFCIGK
ncbi:MAG: tRNA uridine-5-carboxymethylaminomethyl(34) synthesis GTPase MnmE [Betaproteobacteria bacterium]|nr:tRNA uridine-5-carboxymethylaminomethyl(34) synthesis GTPase MnmE [Betaproteobacteria bacterium]